MAPDSCRVVGTWKMSLFSCFGAMGLSCLVGACELSVDANVLKRTLCFASV